MSEQEITQEQEVAVAPGTETSSEIVASSNTNFTRTDDIYLEASTTPSPSPSETPDITPEPDLAPDIGTPITAEDITLSEEAGTTVATAPEPEQTQTETPQLEASQTTQPTETTQQTEPKQEQSLIQWGLSGLSSLCTHASEYCKDLATNNEGTMFGTLMGWASWGFSSFSSIVDTVSSWFSEPSTDTKEQQMHDAELDPSAKTTAGITHERQSEDKNNQDQETGLEAGDHLILKNDRIRKLRELLDQLHQALEEYRLQHEEREEKEEEQETEDYHQEKEELVEVVKEIQDLVPVDSPEIREALETYRIEAYRDDLPKDMVYQNIMEIVNDLMEREKEDDDGVTV